MKTAALSLLLAAVAVANPNPLVDRNGVVNCPALTTIISIMHEQAVATPFCSSYLQISQVTSTSTQTSTPPAVTSTTTISSTDTVTTTVTSYSSGVTTVYPVVAVSTTSTCALGATVVQSSSTDVNVKRAVTTSTTKCTTSTTSTTTKCTTSTTSTTTKCTTTSSTTAKTTTSSSTSTKCTTSLTSPKSIPLGTPTCLTKFIQTDVSSACSCLSIPTPTKVSVTTTTLAAKTVISTVASTASTTTTVTTTATTWTSTYSATQYYTSTFTVLPPPSSTVAPPANPSETFGAYTNLDFAGQDIVSFNCYNNGPPLPAAYSSTSCNNFNDCVNECAYYNAQSYGASSNTTCGAVVYNSGDSGASNGYCYLKTTVFGCGGPNTNTITGVILPLVATDPQ